MPLEIQRARLTFDQHIFLNWIKPALVWVLGCPTIIHVFIRVVTTTLRSLFIRLTEVSVNYSRFHCVILACHFWLIDRLNDVFSRIPLHRLMIALECMINWMKQRLHFERFPPLVLRCNKQPSTSQNNSLQELNSRLYSLKPSQLYIFGVLRC